MSGLKVGWHYTTWDNYDSISRTGLQPRPLNEKNRRACQVGHGVWVYSEQQQGEKLLGLMAERICQYRTARFVELRVEYDRWTSLQFLRQVEEGSMVEMTHEGYWSPNENYWDRWHTEEPFDLIVKPVPREQIVISRDLTAWGWL